jgi:hypothetical protein
MSFDKMIQHAWWIAGDPCMNATVLFVDVTVSTLHGTGPYLALGLTSPYTPFVAFLQKLWTL